MLTYTQFVKIARGGGVMNDAIGTYLWGGINPINIAGVAAGMAGGKPSDKDLEKMDKHPGYSYIPGVGASRLVRKQLDVVDNKNSRLIVGSDMAGLMLPSLLLAIGGWTFTGAKGAAAGAAIGTGTTLGGVLAGLATKRNTDAEQREADKHHNHAMAAFIPGMGAYNLTKRLASIQRREDSRNSK